MRNKFPNPIRSFLLAATLSMLSAVAQADDDLDALFGDEDVVESQNSSNNTASPVGESSTNDSAAAPQSEDDADSESETEALETIELAEEDAPEVRARPVNRLVEEIVVTAQKREENLQDVPISVQAFSEDKLDAMGITNQSDLQLVVPSLNISSLLAFTTVYLRGIGTDAFLTADPSVATYIDGIYYPFAMGLAQDFGVLERVEVLKGPQGTLFGRNATGGALNIVTRDPTLGEFEAQANVTTASFPDLHAKAHLNIPIGDDFAVSISPVYAATEHYLTNVNPDPLQPIEDDVSEGLRIKARLAPFDWFDTTIGYLDMSMNAPGSAMFPAQTATDLAVALGSDREQYQLGDDEVNLDGCCGQTVSNQVLYGNAQFFTPYFDIKLLGSDQQISTTTIADLDGSKESYMTIVNTGMDADIQTAELQFISNSDSWGSDWMRWILGLYHFEGLAGTIQPDAFAEITLFPGLFNTVFDPLNPVFDIVNSLGLQGLVPQLDSENPVFLRGTTLVGTKSKAAYWQGTFTLTDWFDFTLGLRYQDEGREMLSSKAIAVALGQEVLLQDRDTAVKQDGTEVGPTYSEQTFSPKLSFDFRPFSGDGWFAEDSLVYLNYQEATKSGTYNPLAVAGNATFADPETVDAWELGIKTSFLYGTLMFNGAVFDYDMRGLQVQFLGLTTGGAVAFENAEAAHIRGLDFDVTWLFPPNIIEGLVITGGLGWLETAEYTSYPDGRGYIGNTGLATNDQDFSGNRIVKTPEISGNLAIAKAWDLGDGQLEVAGTVYFTEEFHNEPSNREQTIQPGYELYGAHVSYFHEPWQLRVSLFGRNLTDEAYTRGILPTDFGDQSTIGAPRTYGLRMSWEY